MMEMTFLLVIGLTMTNMVSELGFTEFVVGAVGGVLNPALLPVIIFVLFSATEFLVHIQLDIIYDGNAFDHCIGSCNGS